LELAVSHRCRRGVMVRRILVLSATAAVVLLSTPIAQAKGPSQGVIEGPGIAPPLELHDPDERTIGPDLAAMVQESGFLAQLFGDDDVRELPPPGELGARYTVRYTMDGSTENAMVSQFVFPFATTGPVTYMPPGQLYWNNGRTGGGWFSAKRKLRDLVEGFGVSSAKGSAAIAYDEMAGMSNFVFAAALAVGVAAMLWLAAQRWSGRSERPSAKRPHSHGEVADG
jgi:hypothetical protein